MNNRIIKFRVWDKINNTWIKYFSIEPNGDLYVRTPSFNYPGAENGDSYKKSPENYIIAQFTGLLDKNGKEIYEGDIIKYNNKVREVEWISSDKGYDWTGFICQATAYTGIQNGEVIGNIFENPELLKNKE